MKVEISHHAQLIEVTLFLMLLDYLRGLIHPYYGASSVMFSLTEIHNAKITLSFSKRKTLILPLSRGNTLSKCYEASNLPY